MLIQLLLGSSSMENKLFERFAVFYAAENITPKGLSPEVAEEMFKAFEAFTHNPTPQQEAQFRQRFIPDKQKKHTGSELLRLYHRAGKEKNAEPDFVATRNIFVCYRLCYPSDKKIFDRYVIQQNATAISQFCAYIHGRNEDLAPEHRNMEEIDLTGKLYTIASKKDPSYAMAAAKFHRFFGNLEKAEKLATQTAEGVEKYAILGEASFGKENMDVAYTHFRKAESLFNPLTTEALKTRVYLNLQQTCIQLGRTEEAEAYMAKTQGADSKFFNRTAITCIGSTDSYHKEILPLIHTQDFGKAQRALDSVKREYYATFGGEKIFEIIQGIVAGKDVSEKLDDLSKEDREFIQTIYFPFCSLAQDAAFNFLSKWEPFYQTQIFIGQGQYGEAERTLLNASDRLTLKYYYLALCRQKQDDIEGAVQFLQEGVARGHTPCIYALNEITTNYVQALFKEQPEVGEAVLTPEMFDDISDEVALETEVQHLQETQAIPPETPEGAVATEETKGSFRKFDFLPKFLQGKVNSKDILAKFKHDDVLRNAMLKCFTRGVPSPSDDNKASPDFTGVFWAEMLQKPVVRQFFDRIKGKDKRISWRKEFGPQLIQELGGKFEDHGSHMIFKLPTPDGGEVSRYLHNPDHINQSNINHSNGYHRFILKMFEEAGIVF